MTLYIDSLISKDIIALAMSVDLTDWKSLLIQGLIFAIVVSGRD